MPESVSVPVPTFSRAAPVRNVSPQPHDSDISSGETPSLMVPLTVVERLLLPTVNLVPPR